MRNAALFAAGGLFLLLLALAPRTSWGMIELPLWVGSAGTPASPGACGGEAAPAQAVAAGFTTCAVNFDFTAATGAAWLPSQYAFSGAVGTLANWLDCTGTNTALPWHWYAPGVSGAPPCNAFITTDGGTQVLDVQITNGMQNTSCCSFYNQVSIYSNLHGFSGPATPSLPNMYAEITARIGETSNNAVVAGLFTWQDSNAGGNATNPLAFNFAELYPGSGGYGDGSAGDGSPPQPGGYYWTSYANPSNCNFGTQPCNQYVPAGYTSTAYHTYAQLITSDGASAVYGCEWLDNNFMHGCDYGNAAAGVQFTNRNWFILDNNWYNSSNPVPSPATLDLYVEYVRAWSCAAWQTTMCNGATLANGPSPALTYYH